MQTFLEGEAALESEIFSELNFNGKSQKTTDFMAKQCYSEARW